MDHSLSIADEGDSLLKDTKASQLSADLTSTSNSPLNKNSHHSADAKEKPISSENLPPHTSLLCDLVEDLPKNEVADPSTDLDSIPNMTKREISPLQNDPNSLQVSPEDRTSDLLADPDTVIPFIETESPGEEFHKPEDATQTSSPKAGVPFRPSMDLQKAETTLGSKPATSIFHSSTRPSPVASGVPIQKPNLGPSWSSSIFTNTTRRVPSLGVEDPAQKANSGSNPTSSILENKAYPSPVADHHKEDADANIRVSPDRTPTNNRKSQASRENTVHSRNTIPSPPQVFDQSTPRSRNHVSSNTPLSSTEAASGSKTRTTGGDSRLETPTTGGDSQRAISQENSKLRDIILMYLPAVGILCGVLEKNPGLLVYAVSLPWI